MRACHFGQLLVSAGQVLTIIFSDTDSLIIACAGSDFRQLIKKEYEHLYEDVAKFLFEDENSPVAQPGLFKIEGVWKAGLFRSEKAYYLENRQPDGEVVTLKRLRSVARKYQEGLSRETFGQDPLTNSTNVRGLDMRPTLGLEVVMVHQGRTLAHATNFKRSMTVRLPIDSACWLSLLLLFFLQTWILYFRTRATRSLSPSHG